MLYMDNRNSKPKVMIIGGHSTPAFAVLDVLISNYNYNPNVVENREDTTLSSKLMYEVMWVGEKHNQRGNKETSAEYKTVTDKYGLIFENLVAGKLVRKWTKKTFIGGIKEFYKLISGFVKAFRIIRKYDPDVIVSFGGFTAVPLAFWGWISRKKVYTHEQTIVAGLANKIIAKFSRKIMVSWKSSEKYFPESKVVFTGNPIRQDVLQVKSNFTEHLDQSLPTILIWGGNQGSNQINKRVFEILENVLEHANVIHQTGNSTVTNDYQKALEIRQHLPKGIQHRYIVRDYIFKDEIGEAQAKSDLWISRSGANTITEMCLMAKPAILIPIPWTSHDEQTNNAKMVEETGLAMRLIQSDSLTPELLLTHINTALQSLDKDIAFDGNKMLTAQKKARSLIEKDAAEKIAEIIMA